MKTRNRVSFEGIFAQTWQTRNRVSFLRLLGKTRYLHKPGFPRDTAAPTNPRNRVSSEGLLGQTRYLTETRFLSHTIALHPQTQETGFLLSEGLLGKIRYLTETRFLSHTIALHPQTQENGFLIRNCGRKPNRSKKPVSGYQKPDFFIGYTSRNFSEMFSILPSFFQWKQFLLFLHP